MIAPEWRDICLNNKELKVHNAPVRILRGLNNKELKDQPINRPYQLHPVLITKN